MNITLPVWLVVSQWVLLFALGFLVIVMYRQLGFLLHLKDLGTEREGPHIGERAPAFDYISVNQNTGASVHFEPEGGWSLLLFADPGCMSCQDALPIFERFLSKVERPLRVLVLTSAEPVLIAASEAFRTTSLSIGRVSRDVPGRLYHSNITPFACLIDAEGVIRSKGVASNEATIRKIMKGGDQPIIKLESVVK